MARKARINTEKCKGCYYCLDLCPRKAIKKAGKSNEKGYDCVEVDTKICNGCGACYIICPDCCIDIIDDS